MARLMKKCNPNHDHSQSHEFFTMSTESADVRKLLKSYVGLGDVMKFCEEINQFCWSQPEIPIVKIIREYKKENHFLKRVKNQNRE